MKHEDDGHVALGEHAPERVDVHVALEGMPRGGHVRLGDGQVERLGAGELHVRAGGVEVGVVRDRLPGPADRAEQDLLGGAPLVGRDHVLEREQLLHGVAETLPRRRSRVALVTALEPRPLLGRHGARARVRQQVHKDAWAWHVEQVVTCTHKLFLAIRESRHGDRLDRMDPERLDDGCPLTVHAPCVPLAAS